MKKRTNYKKLYGITLKEAKAKIKSEIGHYPRPGRESLISIGSRNGYLYELWLQNSAGSFSLRPFYFHKF